MDLTSLVDPKSYRSITNPNTTQYVDAQLALAFQTDCENLLHKFRDRQNYSFTTFCKIWKETCFLGIFKDMNNILTLQAFIENCFMVVKKILFSGDFHMQTGAIYVLYGLYYKQPINIRVATKFNEICRSLQMQWVKIRLTQSDVEKLEEIVEKHKSMQCLDPVFIYNKMRLDGACNYVASPQPLGLELRNLKRIDLSSEYINVKKPGSGVVQKFKKLMEQEPDLVQFEETDEEYRRLSEKYKDQFFVFPSQICEELKNVYSQTFNVDLGESGERENQLEITKNKAMSNNNAIYRGDRKVVTGLDLEAASTSK